MKDYTIEYVGEIDSGPSDVTVSFSIVGETSDLQEEMVVRNKNIQNWLENDTEEHYHSISKEDGYIDCSVQRNGPVEIIQMDIEIEEVTREPEGGDAIYPAYNKRGEEYDAYKVENSDTGEETLICYGKNGNLF